VTRRFRRAIGICQPHGPASVQPDHNRRSRAGPGIIRSSLKQWDALGTRAWCGYSFSWMACLRARLGTRRRRSEPRHLCARLHPAKRIPRQRRPDQVGLQQLHLPAIHPEGNFPPDAVHEMLPKAGMRWSAPAPTGEAPPGRHQAVCPIRLFPPCQRSGAMRRSRTCGPGADIASRRARGGVTTWFRVVAGRDGVVRIARQLGGSQPVWNVSGVQKVASDYHVRLAQASGRGDVSPCQRREAVTIRPFHHMRVDLGVETSACRQVLNVRVSTPASGEAHRDLPPIEVRSLTRTRLEQTIATCVICHKTGRAVEHRHRRNSSA
jgi:hypothetical protein